MTSIPDYKIKSNIMNNLYKNFKIAVVGATGNVGREMLNILAERGFPLENVTALASERSVGHEVSYGEEGILKVQNLDLYNFKGTHIALFSPGASVSAVYVPKATTAGCVVIDNTSHFRMDPDVPLVIPEINPEAIADYKKRNTIANPNCSTIQLAMVLKPLHDFAKIKRVVASTYQSVSGAGKEAMDELFNQTRALFVNDAIESHCFPKQIAFNAIPHVDMFLPDGQTKEEWKMTVEIKKIIDPSISVTATCVRIPVFIGHAVSANIEFHDPITPKDARKKLQVFPGISVIDDPAENRYITPVECTGDDAVFVSRIRADKTIQNGLNVWIVADNVRKGAALNAIQIAQILMKNFF